MVFSLFAVGGAYVGGCLSPAVGRKIKAVLKSGEAKAVAEVKVAETDVAKKL